MMVPIAVMVTVVIGGPNMQTPSPNLPPDIHWLPEADYKKAVIQLRLQVGGVLEPFDTYGLGVFIPGAVLEIVKLCEDFGLRVRGMDKPISLEMVRKERRGTINYSG